MTKAKRSRKSNASNTSKTSGTTNDASNDTSTDTAAATSSALPSSFSLLPSPPSSTSTLYRSRRKKKVKQSDNQCGGNVKNGRRDLEFIDFHDFNGFGRDRMGAKMATISKMDCRNEQCDTNDGTDGNANQTIPSNPTSPTNPEKPKSPPGSNYGIAEKRWRGEYDEYDVNGANGQIDFHNQYDIHDSRDKYENDKQEEHAENDDNDENDDSSADSTYATYVTAHMKYQSQEEALLGPMGRKETLNPMTSLMLGFGGFGGRSGFSGSNGSSISSSKWNCSNFHIHQRNMKRQLAVQLVQQRWKPKSQFKTKSKRGEQSNGKKEKKARYNTIVAKHDASAAANAIRIDDSDENDDSDSDDDIVAKCNRPQHIKITQGIEHIEHIEHNEQNKLNPRIQTNLAFRRSNADFSSARSYENITFLNSQLILAVDSFGDLDIVRLPLSLDDGGHDGGNECNGCNGINGGNGGSRGHGRHSKNSNKKKNGLENGMGSLVVDRMQLKQLSTRPSEGAAPRSAIDAHLEIYGYQNGHKFVVAAPSGQVRIFSTERAHGNYGNGSLEERHEKRTKRNQDNQRKVRGGGRSRLKSHDTCASPINAEALSLWSALWSCLPHTSATIGPCRRYQRNDDLSLLHMLSARNQGDIILERSNDLVTIPDWDASHTSSLNDYNDFLLERKGVSRSNLSKCNLWAFREMGSGGTLLGAFVDPEGDCFSLRMLDERVAGQTNPTNQANSVFVVTTQLPATSFDDIYSICFSGEYGLVTAHVNSQIHPNILKFWDHRYLRQQPVGSMCLSFPSEDVCGVLPDWEGCISSVSGDSSDSSDPKSLLTLRPIKRNSFDAAMEETFSISNLIGSNDNSDRFAISLSGVVFPDTLSHEHFILRSEQLIVDSTRREILQCISTDSTGNTGDYSDDCSRLPVCFSSGLDCMACFSAGELQPNGFSRDKYISIYDVSRYKDYSSHQIQSQYKYSMSSSRKRTRNDEAISLDHSRICSSLLGTTCANFKDAYGLQSPLRCMAMDDFGSAVACGTQDGDLYLVYGSR